MFCMFVLFKHNINYTFTVQNTLGIQEITSLRTFEEPANIQEITSLHTFEEPAKRAFITCLCFSYASLLKEDGLLLVKLN